MFYFVNTGVLTFRWLSVHSKIKCIEVSLPCFGVSELFFFGFSCDFLPMKNAQNCAVFYFPSPLCFMSDV
jgi:hypothetical protein